jgi:hypothetical protein
MPAVAKAAHAVVEEAMNAGVWVFGDGLGHQKASIVAADGAVADSPYPEAVGGLCVVDVPSRDDCARAAHSFSAHRGGWQRPSARSAPETALSGARKFLLNGAAPAPPRKQPAAPGGGGRRRRETTLWKTAGAFAALCFPNYNR